MIYDTSDPGIGQFKAELSKLPTALRDPASSGERFLQDAAFMWREGLSISRPVALGDAQQERAKKIRQIAGDEAYIKAITLPNDPATKQMIDDLAARNGDIQSDEGLMAGIRSRNKALRQERDEGVAAQTTGGMWGGIAGTALMALADPLVLGTLPLGASWAQGIVKSMLIEAGIAAASEVAIQVPVTSYKKELQSPYSLGDAALSVAGAGVGAGALTGVVRGAARALGFEDMLIAAGRIPGKTAEQKDAIAILRQHADILSDAPVPANMHLDAMAKAADDLTNGRPVRVDEFIEQAPTKPGMARPVDDFTEESISGIAERQQVTELLANEDMTIRVATPGGKPDAKGEIPTVERSAREFLQEIDGDAKAASIIKGCMTGAGKA